MSEGPLMKGSDVRLRVEQGWPERSTVQTSQQSETRVWHHGGCHCGKVSWKVRAPDRPLVFDCNCSICRAKGNLHFIVPYSDFVLIQGHDSLTDYRFGTHKASHLFCKHCGVQSFYRPRSNPDGVGIQLYSVQSRTLRGIALGRFDGQNWEDYFAESGQAMSKLSKL